MDWLIFKYNLTPYNLNLDLIQIKIYDRNPDW